MVDPARQRIEMMPVEIDDIIQTTATRIQVVITKTGKRLWLPINHVDFMPGMTIIPVWLGRKIWGKQCLVKKQKH